MELQRLILLSALLIVSLVLWNAWQKDYPHVAQVAAVQQQASPTTTAISAAPTSVVPSNATTVSNPHLTAPHERIIHVHTDTQNVDIDTLGGNVIKLTLPKYPKDIKTPNIHYELFNNNPNTLYYAQSSLVSTLGPDSNTQAAQYQTTATEYNLAPGQNELRVDLIWKNPQGINVTKTFVFHRNDYLIQVDYNIDNKSQQLWSGNLVTQLSRKETNLSGGSFFQINPYVGAAISSPDDLFQKISFKDIHKQNLDKTIKGGWAAMMEHYFLSAWVPDQNATSRYFSTTTNNDIYTIGMIGPKLEIPAGGHLATSAKLYVGPENAEHLKAIAPGLDLTVNYGWLWFISVIVFWVMKQIHSVVHNWGWSIVLVTVLIKLLFYHLSATSYRSMAGMRSLQPKIKALRERFADDRQKLAQATMELYKQEKINPLGGCLPILVQIPVFIALYMVLMESVELRQAPFILWIRDLSLPDPFYVLPVLMGITMFIQQKLNPPPADPIQEKVMMFMPVVFTVLFINFPAGLVLYWVVNNGLSILQQWLITRSHEAALAKKKTRK